jgi:hypothetical protein
MKALFACSNHTAITPSLRRMLQAASCLQPLAIRLILRSQCAHTKLLVGRAMTLHVLNSTSGSWASLVRTEQKGIDLCHPSLVRRLTCTRVGETLLVQLGTANPGKTTEEKQQWNEGLRGVLNDLRKRRIKDPSGIAAEIARYRREFLSDDTRVVNL